ncbi:SDR family NAD(P)-dependent oxidoreductase [Myceligenerans salitolerans]|uniref:SDR family NAD(P)-dependent oxidoreductase n=1 Tax=Myceligenerans salitolerans TaxID=1230528 RepID=A0ABS3IBP6_9MICO|nr:SDR family NAD(P)-dependent oxidoreductase [Myceligenerans salitolerans]MBO0610444.1 SDR family NAD(P)-dependent oxidoreductase [Myceligenerans salitolerans]
MNEIALVTGGSSGIGLAIAREFVRRGHGVLVVAERGVDEAVRQLRKNTDVPVLGLQTDLAVPAGVEETAARARRLGIRTFVLNAGVGVHGPFAHSPLRDELRLVDLNVRSVVHLAHLVVPGLVAGGDGRLLVTSSIAAAMPAPLFGTYGASKAFLRSFAWSLRHELAGTGVTVTTVLPAATRTPFFRAAEMQRTHIGRAPKSRPAMVARRAVDALHDGRAEVAPGVQARAMVAIARVLPQSVRTAFHGWFYAPGTPPPAADASRTDTSVVRLGADDVSLDARPRRRRRPPCEP